MLNFNGFAAVAFIVWSASIGLPQEPESTTWKMPDPPEHLAKLLKQTKVKWDFYDATLRPRQWPGLTRFDVKLEYRSLNHHQLISAANGQTLQVVPQFRTVNLLVTHRIELPKSYQTDDFWERSLVLHELDHLKLSSHPYWVKAFKSRVQQIGTLRQPWPLGTPPSQADQVARKMVDEAVRQEFDAILQLLDIRYQELDRITEHGLRPLPDHYWDDLSKSTP